MSRPLTTCLLLVVGACGAQAPRSVTPVPIPTPTEGGGAGDELARHEAVLRRSDRGRAGQQSQVREVMRDHEAHERGQMIVYLRLLAVVPPAYVAF
jgi:hypothetical protein